MEDPRYQNLSARLAETGLALRGGFYPDAADSVPPAAPGRASRTLLLIGNTGPDIWPHFAPYDDGKPDALDRWTRAVIEPIASDCGARCVFPFDRPPLPFQRWAQRSEPVASSPLGILIHPDHGLWHAYRAALLFSDVVALPAPDNRPSPCETCADQPCLSACPVEAFGSDGYDVPVCAAYLETPGGSDCLDGGCQARNACPVAADRRYHPDQIRFHMRAFRRAVTRG